MHRCPRCAALVSHYGLCAGCVSRAAALLYTRDRLGEERYQRLVAYSAPRLLVGLLRDRKWFGEAYRRDLSARIGEAWAIARGQIKALNPGGQPL